MRAQRETDGVVGSGRALARCERVAGCYAACVLDRATILAALARLSELLRERGVEGELCPPRTQYLLEDVFAGMESEAAR